jgi:hypothetical protein
VGSGPLKYGSAVLCMAPMTWDKKKKNVAKTTEGNSIKRERSSTLH